MTFSYTEHLGLLELPIKGRSYTWSNMQENPLLEQLDWFFTSTTWILTPWVFPWEELLLVVCHVHCLLPLPYPRQKFFGSKLLG